MLKKISASLMVASMIILPAQADFTDVGSTHPNFEAIQYMEETGVVEGYPDGSYQPEQTINRAEFTKIVMEAVYPGQAVVDSCFDDVLQKDWFSDYICNAKQKGIVGGYPDGTFKPGAEINFVEASQIINIAYGYVAPIEMAPEESTEAEDLEATADTETAESTETDTEDSEELVGMPNPASIYCEEQGGALEIITNEDGSQTGECTLESGEVCEEWAYYRGECPVVEEDETEDWFKTYVETLGAEFAIPTTITTFDHQLTRGEMAEIIYRLQKPDSFKESFNYEELKNQTLVPQQKELDLTDDDPVLGDPEALVTMVEFSDYECPFCKNFSTNTMPLIQENYIETGKLKVVFRDFPLSFHANASSAANAAECARELSDDTTYFDFYDKLYAAESLSREAYETFASELDLDATLFGECLDENRYASEIANDILEANMYGVMGTPTFFINGTQVNGAVPYEDIQAVIEAELTKAEESLSSSDSE